jgi:pilus assembly protein CpaE
LRPRWRGQRPAGRALALTSESAASVVVVDMDLQLGEIAPDLGMTASFSVIDALKNIGTLDRDVLSTMLMKHRSGLSVLASPEDYSFFHLSDHEGSIRLLRLLQEEFEYVVVDAGACDGHVQQALFEMADKIYLITELTLPALRNARRMISYLHGGKEGSRLEVVVNRFNSHNGDIDENSGAKAIGRSFDWRIPNDHAGALAAQNGGVPLAAESACVTKVLVQMARAACGKTVEIEKKTASHFSFFGSGDVAETAKA